MGDVAGLEVKRFALACSTRWGERARFACAIVPTAPAAVPLVVEAAVWGTLLGDLPFDLVDVGAGHADRAYAVRCDDAAFARALVGPEMLRWLGELEGPWGFEVHGSLAMVYGPPSSSVEQPLERLHAFAERAAAALTPARMETIPSRSDASPPDGGGLGTWSEAS